MTGECSDRTPLTQSCELCSHTAEHVSGTILGRQTSNAVVMSWFNGVFLSLCLWFLLTIAQGRCDTFLVIESANAYMAERRRC